MTIENDDNAGGEENFAEFEAKTMSGEGNEVQPQPKVPKADDTLELGSDEAPEATPEQIEEEKRKTRSKRWEARVDNLTARLRDAERRAAEAETKGAGSPEATEAKAPDVNDAKYEFGAADPEYIKDAALFDIRQQLAKEREDGAKLSAEHAARAGVVTKFYEGMASVEKTGAEKYDDFEARIAEAVDARGGESLPPLIGIGIATSPVGADIAYKLATDEAASERLEALAKTDPLKAAQAFGELEGEFTDDDDDLNLADPLDMARALGRMRARVKGGGPKANAERKVTKAPKPPEQRARGGTGHFEVADDTDDFASFERKHMGRSK